MNFSFKRLLLLSAIILPIEIMYRLASAGTVTVQNILNLIILILIIDLILTFLEKRKS